MVKEREDSFTYNIYLLPDSFTMNHLIERSKKRKFSNVTLQVLDPTWIVSKRHIDVAIYHTQNAFDEGRNFARDKATEFLIRVSGQKQIKNALKQFGVKDNSKHILVVSFGGSKEENEEEELEFTRSIDFKIESIDRESLPLSDVKKLCDFYKSEEDLQDTEKAAIERIAALEIH